MNRYVVRYRTTQGGAGEIIIVAESSYYAEQQAWAMFGKENVLTVLWECVEKN